VLTPLLEAKGLTWDDAQIALNAVKVESLKAFLLSNPKDLSALAELVEPIALAAIRPTLAPLLEEKGIAWDLALPAIHDLISAGPSILTASTIAAQKSAAQSLLTQLLKDVGKVGKMILLAQLRPLLEPLLEPKGLSFEDLLPALTELAVSPAGLKRVNKQLQTAVKDPTAYLTKLLGTKTGIVGKKLERLIAIARFTHTLSVRLFRHGVQWEDAMDILAAENILSVQNTNAPLNENEKALQKALNGADIDTLVATISKALHLEDSVNVYSDPMEVISAPALSVGSKLFAAAGQSGTYGTVPTLSMGFKLAKKMVDDSVMVKMKAVDSEVGTADSAAGKDLGSQGSIVGTLSKLFGADLLSLPHVNAAIGNAYGYPLANGLYHPAHMPQTCTKLPFLGRADAKYFVLALAMNDKGFCLAFDPRSETVMFWLDLCVPRTSRGTLNVLHYVLCCCDLTFSRSCRDLLIRLGLSGMQGVSGAAAIGFSKTGSLQKQLPVCPTLLDRRHDYEWHASNAADSDTRPRPTTGPALGREQTGLCEQGVHAGRDGALLAPHSDRLQRPGDVRRVRHRARGHDHGRRHDKRRPPEKKPAVALERPGKFVHSCQDVERREGGECQGQQLDPFLPGHDCRVKGRWSVFGTL
jgi:hypothetical protein